MNFVFTVFVMAFVIATPMLMVLSRFACELSWFVILAPWATALGLAILFFAWVGLLTWNSIRRF